MEGVSQVAKYNILEGFKNQDNYLTGLYVRWGASAESVAVGDVFTVTCVAIAFCTSWSYLKCQARENQV